MLRLKRTLAGMLASLVLVFSILITHIVPISITTGVTALTVTQVACGPDTIEKLNTTLNQTAHALEAAIDTNGRLYAAGAYGVAGSPGAIAMRQKVARVIHDSNEALIQAVNIAKTLTKETFEGSKLVILEKLSQAATGLTVGHQTIDLVLQSVAALINQAVAIAQLFKASDTKHMDRIIPSLNEHLKAFAHVRDINRDFSGLEVFAE